MGSNRHTQKVLAGNTREGRFIQIGMNEFEGYRLAEKGKWESKRFFGTRATAQPEWEAWRAESKAAAYLSVPSNKKKDKATGEEEPKETPTVNAPAKPKKAQEYMYLLSYKMQRTSKPVAVFRSMDAAIDASDALTVALDACGMEGKYDVDELPIWGAGQ